MSQEGVEVELSEQSNIDAKLLDRCCKVAQEHLYELIRELYDQLGDELLLLAKQSESDTEQTLYFDAMRTLRLYRVAFTEAYDEHFISNYQLSCSAIRHGDLPLTSPQPELDQDIMLVGGGYSEELLAISELADKAQQYYALPLAELAHRYAYMLASNTPQPERLPLSPRCIGEAFQAACGVFDVPLKIKLLLYKQLDKQMMSDLHGLYEEVNQLLIERGIYPDAIPGLDERQKEPPQDAAVEMSGAPLSEGESPDSFSAESASFDQMSQLLDLKRADGAADGDVVAVEVDYRSEDVVEALSHLQAERGGDASIGELLLAELKRLPGSHVDGSLASAERNAIDLVGMIFDYIYADNGLSDYVKSVVARLQIPMLKVAILDKTFFNDKHHPARDLLNEFTQTGMGGGDGRLERKITALVERIVNEFSDQIELFAEILNDFHQFMYEEEQACLEQQQIELKKAEMRQQEQRNRVGAIVVEAIVNLAPENAMPELLQAFFDEVWRARLINAYLESTQGGQDGEKWQFYLQFTKDLLWSISPKSSKEERARLAKMTQRLVKVLSDILDESGWEKARVDALFDELGDYHIEALQGASRREEKLKSAASDQPGVAPTFEDIQRELNTIEHDEITLAEGAASQQSGSASDDVSIWDELDEMDRLLNIDDVSLGGSSSDYHEERVAKLPLGTWVEFSDEGEALLRAKLIWRGELDKSLIFANWRNEIVRRCSEAELARKLREWDVRILDSGSMMERALSSAMGILVDTGRH